MIDQLRLDTCSSFDNNCDGLLIERGQCYKAHHFLKVFIKVKTVSKSRTVNYRAHHNTDPFIIRIDHKVVYLITILIVFRLYLLDPANTCT